MDELNKYLVFKIGTSDFDALTNMQVLELSKRYTEVIFEYMNNVLTADVKHNSKLYKSFDDMPETERSNLLSVLVPLRLYLDKSEFKVYLCNDPANLIPAWDHYMPEINAAAYGPGANGDITHTRWLLIDA
jgi:hypothetical protein